MKRILLLGTGGTIACKRTSQGLMPLLSSEEILSFVPDSRTFCSIDSIQVLNIDSTNIQPSHWLTIEKAIEEHYKDYDGFVITHGTDTMAYTAAALSYLIRNSAKPIVITGAQKPIDMENTDARTNLADSLRFASHPNAHGVNIVFDGKVIAGTRGKKERTKSYNAFSSINFPYIATIQEEHILFYLDDKELLKEPVQFFCHLNPNVGLLKLIPSMDASLLDYMAEHYDAVIIESFGVGGLPHYENDNFIDAIAHWIEAGKPVCMATQVTHEGSDMEVYQVGKVIKERFPVLESYDMTLEASVTKMMWALGQTRDMEKFKELFYTTINHDLLFL